MDHIKNHYRFYCEVSSDINEHLPTLHTYAINCTHVTECGVRGAVSSYAFADALMNRPGTKIVGVDLETNGNVERFLDSCKSVGLDAVFYKQSDLECPMEQTDLLFIDTWHVYGHLKRELARWNSHVNRYIILHDTTVDAVHGETIRSGWDPVKQSKDTGIPVEEITKGLWPAVTEFLEWHPEWVLEKRYENNNGLTILVRKSITT
jgi:hypothetical protein